MGTTVRKSDNSFKSQVSNKFDALDRRIQKNDVLFAYDSEDIVAEFNSAGVLQALYLHGPGIDEPIAMVRDVNSNGTFEETELFFFSKDHLNSVHDLTNSEGKPVQRYNYTAYGKTKIEKTSLDVKAKLVDSPYGYTSREWEQESGDYYYRARNYDPRSGRFLSEDPIHFDGGDENLYRYVGNNPVYLRDPTGKNPYLKVIGVLVTGYLLGTKLESCTQKQPPPNILKDNREADRQKCEADKAEMLNKCEQHYYSEKVCESIRKKRCD